MSKEELRELRLENHYLEEQLQSVTAEAEAFKLSLAEYLAPRPRPRTEVLLAVQLLASTAGLPARCGRRECHRTGLCHADDAADPACREHWPEALLDTLVDMAAGIELSALCREREQAALHAFACRQLGVTPGHERAAKTGKPGCAPRKDRLTRPKPNGQAQGHGSAQASRP